MSTLDGPVRAGERPRCRRGPVSEMGLADHDWSYSLVHDGCGRRSRISTPSIRRTCGCGCSSDNGDSPVELGSRFRLRGPRSATLRWSLTSSRSCTLSARPCCFVGERVIQGLDELERFAGAVSLRALELVRLTAESGAYASAAAPGRSLGCATAPGRARGDERTCADVSLSMTAGPAPVGPTRIRATELSCTPGERRAAA